MPVKLPAHTLALLLISILSYTATAAELRSGKWQISLNPTFTNSKLIQFDGGAEAEGTGA